MSEQARNLQGTPAAWSLGFGSGHPVVPGRVDTHFHGGVAAGDSGVGVGASGLGNRSAGSGGGGHVDSRSARETPEWYRRVAVAASGLSLIVVLMLWVAIR